MNADIIRKIFVLLPLVFICGYTSHADPTTNAQTSVHSQPEPLPKLVYIGGEFHKPGPYPWTNGMTAANLVHQAGGFTIFAWSTIVIIHYDGSRERYHLKASGREMTNGTDYIIPDIPLKPGDQIQNPRP